MNNEQGSQELIPLEQQTITFRGLPLVVVRLPDGRPGVVLRWICDNLHLDSNAQVRRIQRTEAIADDLVYVQVQTDGGFQTMPTLVLHATPYWLATIDTRRMAEDDERRLEILHYQREVVDVLYAWASTPKSLSSDQTLVPAEPITRSTRPTQDALLQEWHDYYLQMAAFLEWQMDVEQWRENVESRLEGVEAMTGLIPEILEQLGPQTLTPRHQQQAKAYVQQLSKATGKHSATIYNDLYTAFSVPRYQDIPEFDWERVEQWFKVQLEQKRK